MQVAVAAAWNRASFVAEARNSLLVRDPPSGVGLGDVVGLLWAGAEFRIPMSREIGGALVPTVSWPFVGGPVTYGPIVSFAIRLTFGPLRGSSVTSLGDPSRRTPPEPE